MLPRFYTPPCGQQVVLHSIPVFAAQPQDTLAISVPARYSVLCGCFACLRHPDVQQHRMCNSGYPQNASNIPTQTQCCTGKLLTWQHSVKATGGILQKSTNMSCGLQPATQTECTNWKVHTHTATWVTFSQPSCQLPAPVRMPCVPHVRTT